MLLLRVTSSVRMVLCTGALFPFEAAAAGAGVVPADLDDPHRLALGGTLGTGSTVAGHKALSGRLGHLLPLGSGTGFRTSMVSSILMLDSRMESTI